MLPQTWEDPEHKSEELGGIAVCTSERLHLMPSTLSLHLAA